MPASLLEQLLKQSNALIICGGDVCYFILIRFFLNNIAKNYDF